MAYVHEVGLVHRSTTELLRLSAAIVGELARRDVVRTNDAPIGQYAEWLAEQILGGSRVTNSNPAIDIVGTNEFGNVQVKARILRGGGMKDRQLSPFRSTTGPGYDFVLVLLFCSDFTVKRAVILSAGVVAGHGRHSAHVNGRIVRATDEFLSLGVDLTRRFNEFINADGS